MGDTVHVHPHTPQSLHSTAHHVTDSQSHTGTHTPDTTHKPPSRKRGAPIAWKCSEASHKGRVQTEGPPVYRPSHLGLLW